MELAWLLFSSWMSQLKSPRKAHTHFSLYICCMCVCMCLPAHLHLCMWVSVSLLWHLWASFNCPRGSGLRDGSLIFLFLFFLFLPLILLPSLSLHICLSLSCICLWSSSHSSIFCQRRTREKREHPDCLRLPFLLSPTAPEPGLTSQLCPHNTLQPELQGRVGPKHKGSTSKLLTDSVGPSLFLRKLQCSQGWSLILPQNSRDHQLLHFPIWVPWTSLQSAVLLLTFSIKTLFHCLGKRLGEKKKIIIVYPTLVSCRFFPPVLCI